MAEGVKLLWPLGNTRMGRETLLSDFGANEPWRNFPHTGIDIGRYGDPVRAAHTGYISNVYLNMTWNGYGVTVRNPALGISTSYLHMAEAPLFVKGDLVEAGHQLGCVGRTNGGTRDMAAHLHFSYEGPDPDPVFDDPWPHFVGHIDPWPRFVDRIEEEVPMGETIDLTEKYYNGTYMGGGPARWGRPLVQADTIIVHHTAGFYGKPLTSQSTREQEEAQIHRMAEDHRERFGIGPAYHYVIVPSGRQYAVGKAGTMRAHAKGRRRDIGYMTDPKWNRVGVGVVLFGDFETQRPERPVLQALKSVVAEIRGWMTTPREVHVMMHGTLPTVNASGEWFSQATNCPGRFLMSVLASMALDPSPEVEVNDRFDEGEVTGWNKAITEMEGHLRVMRDETP
jgi:hypothetical protein